MKQHHYQPFAMPDFVADMQRRMEQIAALNPMLRAAQQQAAADAAGRRKKRGRDRASSARRSIINAGPLAQPGPAFDDADALQSPAGPDAGGPAAGEQALAGLDAAPAEPPEGGGWMDMDFGPPDGDDGDYGYDEAAPVENALPDFAFDGAHLAHLPASMTMVWPERPALALVAACAAEGHPGPEQAATPTSMRTVHTGCQQLASPGTQACYRMCGHGVPAILQFD